MERGENAFGGEAMTKLTKRTKKVQIDDDQDVNDWDRVLRAFREHYHPTLTSRFSKQQHASSSSSTTGNETSDSNPICLFSDLFSNKTTVLCGFDGGTCKAVDTTHLTSDVIVLDQQDVWKHKGLSCIRCSRVSPNIFFSSSATDSVIRLWDTRLSTKTPSQKFSSDSDGNPTKSKTSKKKPILQFDVNCNDQLLCGGTETVEEDSFLLFWDVRSTKLLGAYWESHSDDITAVRFHPSQGHSLASGSTDGLLNVFNLLETAEDDALQYSFNTNSSVDTVHWPTSEINPSQVVCVTHTNEVQVWDSVTGDRVTEISRVPIAAAMMRSNPEAVYISSCHNLTDTSQLGLIACSVSGGSARLLELNNELKPSPRGIFMDQTSVIQTAQLLPLDHRWITFDDLGMLKLWNLQASLSQATNVTRTVEASGRSNRSKRFKPYGKGE